MPPIYSLNKLAIILGHPRKRLEEIAARSALLYQPFLRKRPGKKPRPIDNPVSPLKEIQQRIYRRILRHAVLPEFFHGGVSGKSAETNARIHIAQKTVVTVDVEGCFPSITDEMVFKVWREHFGFSRDVAGLLARLTTFRHHLPQGASTSLSLANLVMLPALLQVRNRAQKSNLLFGQFVDDSGLSGRTIDDGLITEISSALKGVELRISRDKIRVMRAGEPHIITGLTTNTKLGIPKKKRSDIRAAVFQLERQSPSARVFAKSFQSAAGRVKRMSRYHPTKGHQLMERLRRLGRRAGLKDMTRKTPPAAPKEVRETGALPS